MVFGSSGAACGKGGKHDGGTSGKYYMHTASHSDVKCQGGWRWCNKCSTLHFGKDAKPCSAGGNHDSTGSGEYFPGWTDVKQEAKADAKVAVYQSGWRWCSKCYALFYGPSKSQTACPAKGTHDDTGSGEYQVVVGDVAPKEANQDGWRWCNKCHGLWYSGAGGACGKGGQHDGTGSGKYFMHTASHLGGKCQGSWRWCNKCSSLHFGKDSKPCAAGGNHDATGSGEYFAGQK
jgi:hypothetical protein